MSSDGPRRSWATFPPHVISEIHRAADQGLYYIRGAGAWRAVPSFDDLVFLGASVSRYPLEGYRERCDTDVTIGARFASKPVELKIPITIAGMSFGALSANAKRALGLGASAMGTSFDHRRRRDDRWRNGDPSQDPGLPGPAVALRHEPRRSAHRADAIEVVVGQGAKPGGGGMLLGQKITERVAGMRTLPVGIDQRSACRHPGLDWSR